jgi:hypothetical protein
MIKNMATAAWLSLVVVGQATFAEQITSSLPKDGTWVTYNISAQSGGSVQTDDSADSDDAAQSNDGLPVSIKKTATISLVGSAKERVGECRWVELKYVDAGDDPDVSVYKCLIPEKALRDADRPMLSVVRAWIKHNDEQVEELTPAILAGGDPKRFCSLDDEMLFWPGILRRCKRIAREKKDRQLSRPQDRHFRGTGGKGRKGIRGLQARRQAHRNSGISDVDASLHSARLRVRPCPERQYW